MSINEKMTAIANPIRSLTSEVNSLTLDDMATNLNDCVNANADLEKVLYGTDFGGKSYREVLWEALQNHGNGVYQLYRQFYHWTDEAYYPIYPIKSVGGDTSMTQIFYSSYITNTKVPIFAERFNLGACFSWSKVHTIPLLVVDEATVLSTCFNNALEMTNLTIEGTLACDVAMGSCSKLTRDSILGKLATEEQIAKGKNLCVIGNNTYYGGLFGALKDLTAEGTTRTLTLHATAKENITEDEIAYAQNKGWTVA